MQSKFNMAPSGSEVANASESYPAIREGDSNESEGEASEKLCERQSQGAVGPDNNMSFGAASADSSYETATTTTSGSTTRSRVVDVLASLEEAIAVAREAQQLEAASAARRPSRTSMKRHKRITRASNDATTGLIDGDDTFTTITDGSTTRRSVVDILVSLEEAISIAKEAHKLEILNSHSIHGRSPVKHRRSVRSSNQQEKRTGSSSSERWHHSKRRGSSVPTEGRKHGDHSSLRRKSSSSSPVRSRRRSADTDDSNSSVSVVVIVNGKKKRKTKRSSSSPKRRRRRSSDSAEKRNKTSEAERNGSGSPCRSRRRSSREGDRSSRGKDEADVSSKRQSRGSPSRRKQSHEVEHYNRSNKEHPERYTSPSPSRRRKLSSVAPAESLSTPNTRISNSPRRWIAALSPEAIRKKAAATGEGERQSRSPSHRKRVSSSPLVEGATARRNRKNVNTSTLASSSAIEVGEGDGLEKQGIEYHLSMIDQTNIEAHHGEDPTSSIVSGMVHSAPCGANPWNAERGKDEIFQVLHAGTCSFGVPSNHNHVRHALQESDAKSLPGVPFAYGSEGNRKAKDARWIGTCAAGSDDPKTRQDEFSVQTEDSALSRQTWGEPKTPSHSTPSPTTSHSRKLLSPPGSSPRTVIFPLDGAETTMKHHGQRMGGSSSSVTPSTKRGTVTIMTPSNKKKHALSIAPLIGECDQQPVSAEGKSWHGSSTTGQDLPLKSLSDHTSSGSQEGGPAPNSGDSLSLSDHGGLLARPSPLGRAALAKLGVVSTVNRQESYRSLAKKGMLPSKDDSPLTLRSHLKADQSSLGRSLGTINTEPLLNSRLQGSQRSLTKSVVSAHTAPPQLMSSQLPPTHSKSKSPSLRSRRRQALQAPQNLNSASPTAETEPIPTSGLQQSLGSMGATVISAPSEFQSQSTPPATPTNAKQSFATCPHLQERQSPLGNILPAVQTGSIPTLNMQIDSVDDVFNMSPSLSTTASTAHLRTDIPEHHPRNRLAKSNQAQIESEDKKLKNDIYRIGLTGILATPTSPRKRLSDRDGISKVTFDASIGEIGNQTINGTGPPLLEEPVLRMEPSSTLNLRGNDSRQPLEKEVPSVRTEDQPRVRVEQSPRTLPRKKLTKDGQPNQASLKSPERFNYYSIGAGILASPTTRVRGEVIKELYQIENSEVAREFKMNDSSLASPASKSTIQDIQGSLARSRASPERLSATNRTARIVSESPRTPVRKQLTKNNIHAKTTKVGSNHLSAAGILASPKGNKRKVVHENRSRTEEKSRTPTLHKPISTSLQEKDETPQQSQSSPGSRTSRSAASRALSSAQGGYPRSKISCKARPSSPTHSRWNGPFESINTASTSYLEPERSSFRPNKDHSLNVGARNIRTNACGHSSDTPRPAFSKTANSFAVKTTGPQLTHNNTRPLRRTSSLVNGAEAEKLVGTRGRHARIGNSRLEDLERRSRPASPNKKDSNRRAIRHRLDRPPSPRQSTNENQERFRQAGIARFRRAGLQA